MPSEQARAGERRGAEPLDHAVPSLEPGRDRQRGEGRRHHRERQHARGQRVDRALVEVDADRCAPATPPTSTSTGITTASSSCSPLRTISRASIEAWASTWRRKRGRAGRRGEGPHCVSHRPAHRVRAPGRSARGRRPRGCAGPGSATRAGRSCCSHHAATVASVVLSAGPATSRLTSLIAVTVDPRPECRLQRRRRAFRERLGHHQPDRGRPAPGQLRRRARRRSAGPGR